MSDIRHCSVCGEESSEESWQLAGALTDVEKGACVYCLCKRGVTPDLLWRAVEAGRKMAQGGA